MSERIWCDGTDEFGNLVIKVANMEPMDAARRSRLYTAAPKLLAALETIAASSNRAWQGYTAHAVAYELGGLAREAITEAKGTHQLAPHTGHREASASPV